MHVALCVVQQALNLVSLSHVEGVHAAFEFPSSGFGGRGVGRCGESLIFPSVKIVNKCMSNVGVHFFEGEFLHVGEFQVGDFEDVVFGYSVSGAANCDVVDRTGVGTGVLRSVLARIHICKCLNGLATCHEAGDSL